MEKEDKQRHALHPPVVEKTVSQETKTQQNKPKQNIPDRSIMAESKISSIKGKYDGATPKEVNSDGVMSLANVEKGWNEIYRLAGFGSSSEAKKLMLRVGIYVHAAVNGASDVGGWNSSMVLGDGTSVSSSIVPLALAGEHRRFLRANVVEYLDYFRASEAWQELETVKRAAYAADVPVRIFYAVADFLDKCHYLTQEESGHQSRVRQSRLAKAQASRGGNSYEKAKHDKVLEDISLVEGGGTSGREVVF